MTSCSQMDGLREELHENGFDAEQTKGLTTTMEETMDSKFDQVLDSIEAFRSETNVQLGSVKESMDGLRREMGTEIQSVKKAFLTVVARWAPNSVR